MYSRTESCYSTENYRHWSRHGSTHQQVGEFPMDFHREIMNFNAQCTLVITYNDATHYSLVHIAWTDILIYELYFNAYKFITWTYAHYLSWKNTTGFTHYHHGVWVYFSECCTNLSMCSVWNIFFIICSFNVNLGDIMNSVAALFTLCLIW